MSPWEHVSPAQGTGRSGSERHHFGALRGCSQQPGSTTGWWHGPDPRSFGWHWAHWIPPQGTAQLVAMSRRVGAISGAAAKFAAGFAPPHPRCLWPRPVLRALQEPNIKVKQGDALPGGLCSPVRGGFGSRDRTNSSMGTHSCSLPPRHQAPALVFFRGAHYSCNGFGCLHTG